jgi:hypothetical protein
MTVKVGGLLAKLGPALQKAHEAHKADETDLGSFGDLPAGIENGIAQLVECKFDTYKKGDLTGQYFFYAAGVVVAPTEFRDKDGVTHKIEGLRTSITEPLCDTPTRTRKTVDEHIQWIYNELRKLGVDTSKMNYDDLEPTAAALKEDQPHFRFRTWKGQKQLTGPYKDQEPRTQHSWMGAVEYSPGEAGGTSGLTDAHDAAAAAGVSGDPNIMDEMDKGGDLDSLGTRADGGDETAQVRLTEMATAEGITEEEIKGVDSWANVVELIRAADQGGDDTPVPAGPPAVGDVYKYEVTAKDPRTKKVVKKQVEVEVTASNHKSKTATVKNLDDGKSVYKDVPWDNLIEP